MSGKQIIAINRTVDKQDQGKLKAQELFWQAQVKSLEEKLFVESKKPRKEIECLKEAFKDEKRKQKKLKEKTKEEHEENK